MRILVVDDEAAVREVLTQRLASWGHEVTAARDAEEAAGRAAAEAPDLVIADVVLPGLSGVELLERLKAGDPARPVVLITAHGSIDDAVAAMKRGADDFLTKPVDPELLRSMVESMAVRLEDSRQAEELQRILDRGSGAPGMVGRSPAMVELVRLIASVAASDAAVLVSGESGTGKELVARTIHSLSERRDGPFVAVNAAAVPEGLMESEFFGHEKGAFTGASEQRAGCLERADGGTLLLDEITEMPMALQPKLLRVLEEGSVRRVGGSREIPFSVRVVAATNRDPLGAVEQQLLREDLYYRLAVIPIHVPPLRERAEDIPLLAQHFVRELNAKHGTAVEGIGEEARQALLDHRWPGNVRELRNAIERAVILAQRGWIETSHLAPLVSVTARERSAGLHIPPGTTVAEAERLLILDTLRRAEGNRTETARRLGVDVKTIRNKLKRYGESSDES
ncbi:MAG TPA: sigma-54 dependent transcriptional regulator [Methylomirabilota bacterium]|nr:sigma-54 dependent transcriptional regulator [Methylomirabilota bacterium]